MKRIKRFIRSPKITLVMFGMAIALLLFSSIGGTRAALTYFSEVYESRVEMSNIGVTLLEKNVGSKRGEAQPISNRDYGNLADGDWHEETGVLLQGMLGDDKQPKPGKKYEEELSVQNTGSIDQYVRVSIYKYWIDGQTEGETTKKLKLDPGLIEVELDHDGPKGSNSDWLLDEEASNWEDGGERAVLYYSKALPVNGTTPTFTKSVKISKDIVNKVSQEESVSTEGGKTYKTIKTIYDYDGMKFCVEAKVDAVQDHNAQDAIWSAWGRKVTINNRTLSLD